MSGIHDREPPSHIPYSNQAEELVFTLSDALDRDGSDTAVKYSQTILSYINSPLDLVSVEEMKRVSPGLFKHEYIQKLRGYPAVAWNGTTGQWEVQRTGKGKEAEASLDLTAQTDAQGYTPLESEAIACQQLLGLLKLRDAREDAWAQLEKTEPSVLEALIGEVEDEGEVLRGQKGPRTAVVLRSILHNQTTLLVDGQDAGPLFTSAHVDGIEKIRNVCSSLSAGEEHDKVDGNRTWAMWIQDLDDLGGKAAATHIDDFAYREDSSEYMSD